MYENFIHTLVTLSLIHIFFPGGDIGKLAVCGTANDVAVCGAVPKYLSCGFILEEGLPLETLKKLIQSMAKACQSAGIQVVTGCLLYTSRCV